MTPLTKSKTRLEPEIVPVADHSRHFHTYDMGCASALIAVGYDLIFLDREQGTRTRFVFSNDEGIAETAVSYWSKQLALDANTYFITVKSLEKRIMDV